MDIERSNDVLVTVRNDEVEANPYQYRTHFDGIAELADSIKKHGIILPPRARPNPGTRGKPYQLACGERRHRANQVAGNDTIQLLVRPLSDDEMIEILFNENLARKDATPLEEADGFKAALDRGYTVEKLVDKFHKTKAYIYARLKLCELGPVPRKALAAGELSPSIALMIARIADVKLQVQATNEVLGRADREHYEGVEPDRIQLAEGEEAVGPTNKFGYELQPFTVRQAQLHMQRKYMLRLEQAPFDIADATLVAKAGACTPCPKRTGNQRELFADVKSADVCTDLVCFDSKKKADWDRKAAAAARDGARVLNAKETENVFVPWGNGTEVKTESAYVAPNAKVPYELDPSGKKTWKSMLGGELDKVAKAVAQDATGAARTLIDKSSALAALKKSGKIKEAKAEAAARSKGNDSYRRDQKNRMEKAKRKHATVRIAAERIVTTIDKYCEPMIGGAVRFSSLDQWRWFAMCIVRAVDAEDGKRVASRRGLELVKSKMNSARNASEKTLEPWIEHKDRTAAELFGLCVELLAVFRATGVWQTDYNPNFQGAVEAFGLDLKKLAKEADDSKPTNQPAAAAKKLTGCKAKSVGYKCQLPNRHPGRHSGTKNGKQYDWDSNSGTLTDAPKKGKK